MLRVLACVYDQHNLWLVGAAAVVCICSWIVAVLGLGRMEMADARHRHAWLLLAGAAAGCGTWATHFISMLAFDPGLPIGFSLPVTLLSAAAGVACSWSAFEAHRSLAGPLSWLLAAFLLALGIVGVHFVGMMGVEAAARQAWHFDLVIASLLLVMAFAALGFAALSRATTNARRLVVSAFFVAGVVSLHFTAMGALTLVPDPRVAPPANVLDRDGLAATVTIAAAALIVIAAVAVLADRRIVEERLRRAEEADRAKSSFLASMSHELRTPLNAIIGYSELIEETSSEAGVVADARNVRESAGRLLTLVNDVLDLAKIEANRLVVTNAEFDLAELMDTLRHAMERMAEERGNTLIIEPCPRPLLVVGDPPRIKQCLLSLVSNAAKFAEQGVIRVETRVAGFLVEIAVSDTGIGMSEGQLERLFKPFAQQGGARGYSGAGLGLSIVKRLMDLMGGEILVQSAPRAGSTFTLRLPSPAAMAARAEEEMRHSNPSQALLKLAVWSQRPKAA